MNDLTTVEQNRLESLEETIEKGMRSFIAVGMALGEIKEKRLYRAQYDSFDTYCMERWSFTASRGRQLMSAVEALASLPEELPQPDNAAQAHALSRVPEEDRAEVWNEVLSGDAPVTAAEIRSVAERRAEEREASLTLGDTNMAEVGPIFKRALDALREARDAAEALSKSSAKEWLLTSGSALLKHIRDAHDHVKAARPAACCPLCDGAGCRKCMDTGWVNKSRMDALRSPR
jgi:hypothetical protein